MEKNTPLMEQYFTVKEQYPNTLLLFQVGDFYELFYDDAKTASAYLAITLTKRGKNKGQDIPLCGIPVHALNHYLTKLIRGGFRVAICDQLTPPSPGTQPSPSRGYGGQAVVQRGVTNVFTPGTLTDMALLDEKSASYLLSFYPLQDHWALMFSEVLTAQLFATTIHAGSNRAVEAELARFFPDEVLIPALGQYTTFERYFKQLGYCTSVTQASDTAGTPIARAWIEQQFSPHILTKLNEQPAVNASLEQLFSYLHKNQSRALEQFKTIHFYQPDDYLVLDAATQKNLDLVKNNLDGSRKHTLLAVMDCARTAMGARTIKKWLLRPLVQKAGIEQRLNLVDALTSNIDIMQKLERQLTPLADLERIIGRVALGRATLPDYLALKHSLTLVPGIKAVLEELRPQGDGVSLAATLADKMVDFSSLCSLLESSINDDPTHPGTIKQGFDYELDRLRTLLTGGHQAIVALENQEIAATGIASLKIGFTDIAGYYIEVTNPNLFKVPEDRYQHKQTLVNRKRFVTQELKSLEADLFKAQHEIEAIERAVFDRVKQEIAAYTSPLRQLAQALAYLDGLFGLAHLAYHNNYVRPTFNDRRTLTIKDGRHPVVEQALGPAFIPNDTQLDDQQSLLIITGPNMGGKSTYLRQVALTCIMAQCGSFVPARYADLPILDRVFTRIGAGDNVAEGKSTFLVEMEETATICTQATRNSLVILDEVGRGTSTFDGMALAQAIIEYIAQQLGARCLFATHYHELTHLSDSIGSIANYHADCRKANDTIIFLHKIIPGIAQSSFGVEVAKLAQLPEVITMRAAQLLEEIEKGNHPVALRAVVQDVSLRQGFDELLKETGIAHDRLRAVLGHRSFSEGDAKGEYTHLEAQLKKYQELFAQLRDIDFDNLSPKQAFDLLWEMKKRL
jgi:DNA mismatch repair protein MutS